MFNDYSNLINKKRLQQHLGFFFAQLIVDFWDPHFFDFDLRKIYFEKTTMPWKLQLAHCSEHSTKNIFKIIFLEQKKMCFDIEKKSTLLTIWFLPLWPKRRKISKIGRQLFSKICLRNDMKWKKWCYISNLFAEVS